MNAEYIRLCSIPAVQEKIREGMGPLQDDDFLICPGGKKVRGNDCCNKLGCKKESPKCYMEPFIHLPQVHDLMDEKRGLWGMVDWRRCGAFVQTNGMLQVTSKARSFLATPELALLRALMWQSSCLISAPSG